MDSREKLFEGFGDTHEKWFKIFANFLAVVIVSSPISSTRGVRER